MHNKYFNYFLDCIFPEFCLGCNQEGNLVCSSCFKNNPLGGLFCCPVCHHTTPHGRVCEICQATASISQIIALTTYNEESVFGQLIRNFKYSFSESAKKIIAEYIDEANEIIQTISSSTIHYIIPVPLHRRRQAERGFNQADTIAEVVSRKIMIPKISALVRERATKQQATLSREERKNNVKNAFTLCSSKFDLQDRICLLVDDVYTTGSTMGECATVLRAAGAKDVIGFTLARG